MGDPVEGIVSGTVSTGVLYLAGVVTDTSNLTSAEALVEALYLFANPEHPEKSLEELEELLAQTMAGTPRPAIATKRRLTPERIADIVAAYEAGGSAQAVGQRCDVGVSTVLRLVRREGGTVRNQPMPRNVLIEGVRLYESGMSLQKVVDRLEVSKSSLLRGFKEYGVELRQGRSRGSQTP